MQHQCDDRRDSKFQSDLSTLEMAGNWMQL